jgi:Holliday junction resolvase RusA-like endonuclease
VFVAGTPVSANAMYGPRGRGAAKRLTKEAVVWRDAVADSLMEWRSAARILGPALSVVCLVQGVRGDADNYLKLIVDGVKIGLMIDDRHFVRVSAEKRPLRRGGKAGAWIEVWRAAAVADEKTAG